ncbi:MAG: putative lipid II flippase FtsW [Deltaproteobacteria bacterium]|nr:putative lipid II flippase FtsW [Deltaproteobacteria bacterium]
MFKVREIDKPLILAMMALVAIGFVMVWSTSYIMAMKRYGNEYFFVRKHLIFITLGFFLFFIAANVEYHLYQRWTYFIFFASLMSLIILIFLPGIGGEAGGARRWIRLGLITFQPSEPAKLAVIIYLSYYLAAKKEKLKSFAVGIVPPMIMSGLITALILKEPDFGTAVSLGAMSIIMMFIAGVRLRYLFSILLAAMPFIYLMVTKVDYRMKRVLVFLDPWRDSGGAGFQLVQSLIAFGAGGIWGVGLGEGKQKLFYLPEAHTDFILSVVGEELGLIGISAVIILYLTILFSGIRIALKAKDLYGRYLAVGITLLIVLQAATNMAVVLALLPTKGLTLPFISYGGTSLVVNMTAMGILLNIYKTGVRSHLSAVSQAGGA